jgi:uncharacterized membrane protein YcaP (DUF421 family)
MNEIDSLKPFDWERMFHADHVPWAYLAEIGLRTSIMFLVLIIALKFLSKRGVKQLSVFELAILIALGSATGDPMFYSHIPVTFGIVVLLVIILLYRFITRLTGNNKTMERVLEGKPICLLNEGRIQYAPYQRIGLPYDKFFAELRLKNISHLGQVHKVYLETSGEMSVYPYPDNEVRSGLPIFPELIDNPVRHVHAAGDYACIYCGNVQLIENAKVPCSICNHTAWLEARSEPRVH